MVFRNKGFFLISVILLALLFTACGHSAAPAAADPVPVQTVTPSPEPTPTPTPEPVRVTLQRSDGSQLVLPEETAQVQIDDPALIDGLITAAVTLKDLRDISLADGLEFDRQDITDLQTAYPSAQISYNVIINGRTIDKSFTTVTLSDLNSPVVLEAARELKKMPRLERIDLTGLGGFTQDPERINESKTGYCFPSALTPEDIRLLKEACPETVIDCPFLLFGRKVSTADERLEYVDTNITDEGVENTLRPILPAMGELNYLKLDKCEVSSPVMAQLRDDFPDIKVVWRVYFSSYGETADGTMAVYNCLTDTERVWATGCVTDNFAKELQYCTDVKYLDLGHNCITSIDFVRYMPKLEVAVLSVSWVESLEPLASCPNLEYLECFSSHVTDVSPLAACTNLRYLNISNLPSVKDISALYDLDLTRFYCTMSYIPAEQQEEFRTRHPECDCEFGWVDPSKGYWRFLDGNFMNTDPSNRNERYALLYEQFGYDSTANQSK